jgi:hypothetical protein
MKMTDKNNKAREDYKNKLINKICKYCGAEYSGTRNSRLCKNCKNKRVVVNKKIVKPIVCKKCKSTIRYKEVPTKGVLPYIIGEVCEKCKAVSRLNASKRMSSDNNPAIKLHGRRRAKMSKEEVRKYNSERMKTNNPMKRPEIAKKVAETTKAKRASGVLSSKIGEAHGAWKGNRCRAQSIRSRLYRCWIFPILEANDFKCSICGCSGRLEVHHESESFRDILSKFLNGQRLNDLTSSEFQKLSDDIVKYHINTPVIGKVYCVRHHKSVDNRRR